MVETLKPTAGDLFSLPVHYDIPPYQRKYVWSKEAHWQPLWSDILETTGTIQKLLQDRIIASKQVNPNLIDGHFFGSLITKLKGTSGHINLRTVVDGQQRITTLQLLMAAMIDVFRENGIDKYSIQLTNYVVNSSSAQLTTQHNLKLDPQVGDYQTFSEIMNACQNNESVSKSLSKLSECYYYYRDEVEQFIQQSGSHWEARSEALYLTLLHGIRFVEIQLDPNENEHKIFETLNARGKPLTEYEKSKNYILSVATDCSDTDYEIYNKFLDRYDDGPFWSRAARQPRFDGSRIELFFRHWVHIELGKRPTDSNIYNDFRKHAEGMIAKKRSRLEMMMGRMDEFANAFKAIVSYPDKPTDISDSLALFEYRRRVLNNGVFLPVVMALKTKLCSYGEFEAGLSILESYLIRRFIVNAQNRGLNELVANILGKIKKARGSDVLDALREELEAARRASRWPSDNEVHQDVMSRDMYSTSPRLASRLRLVLEGIALRIHLASASVPFDNLGTLTIEHIVPQDWKKHWSDVGVDTDVVDWDVILGRLGNLTLVSGPMNSELSNKSWDDKRPILANDNLYLNKDIVNHLDDNRQWDHAAIRERGDRLANLICDIWPR